MTSFEGGYTVLPAIVSASNSDENLDINSNSVDINSNSVDRNSNSLDSRNSEDADQNVKGNNARSPGQKATEDMVLPDAPFSSILQSTRPTYVDENR